MRALLILALTLMIGLWSAPVVAQGDQTVAPMSMSEPHDCCGAAEMGSGPSVCAACLVLPEAGEARLGRVARLVQFVPLVRTGAGHSHGPPRKPPREALFS